ncbi:sensor histidine kinase [Catenuloplanes japonicus]|uniref:sensor histidine kinase n=1 Tax=Catenuloplanes japonicus TaxID=33876 RepID=UPI0012FA0FEB|nr:HAMP domain-containing sensor histidine kinase [Catenuloplanes japonicus]
MNPIPMPADRALRRLRWLLTTWFTLVLAVGVVVLVAAVAATTRSHATYGRADTDLAALLGLLGVAALAVFAPATWVLLGFLLEPVTRSLAVQESFLGTAAHDLRTPLATLGALLDTARHDPAAIARAARLVARSGDTVEDLLLRARLASGTLAVTPRPTRLDQVAEAVLTDLTGTDPEVTEDGDGVVVRLDGHVIALHASPVIARIDAALVERAIANLVHNALRHGHAPGETARITVTVRAEDGRAAVTVADEGPGFRPGERQARLGLSVVRWVARSHGGALLLGTGPQPGTRLRLVLPADLNRRTGR